jgi:hypothetical protein
MVNAIAKQIRDNAINNDMNYLVVVTGPTRSGKSGLAVRLGELIDSKFSARHIVTTPEDFMALIDDPTVKKGSVILWDEIGVEYYSRDFYTDRNKSLNHVFQTMGHKNLVIIVTTPAKSYLDSHLQKLMNVYIETQKREKNYIRAKFLFTQYNSRFDKTYYKRPQIWRDGIPCVVEVMDFKRCAPKLWSSYLAKLTKYKNELSKKNRNQIEQRARNETAAARSNDDIIREVLKHKREYYNRIKRIKQGLIMSRHGIGKARALSIKDAVEEKLGLN